jgi:phage shock protein PspC (stress-responsive transcriptional regulator)
VEKPVLRRSIDNKVFAGVCGGVARFLGLDATLVRVGWVLMAFFGAGLAAYLIAWFTIPDDMEQRSSLPVVLLILLLVLPTACFVCGWIPLMVMSEQ